MLLSLRVFPFGRTCYFSVDSPDPRGLVSVQSTLSTTDLNADVSYSLVSGDSLVDNQLFTIVGVSCMLISIPIMSSVVITPFVSGLPI